MIKKYILCFLSALLLSVSYISLSASALSVSPSVEDIYTIFTTSDAFAYGRTNNVIIIATPSYTYNGKPSYQAYYISSSVSELSFTLSNNTFVSTTHPDCTYYDVYWNGSSWGWRGRGSSPLQAIPYIANADITDYIYSNMTLDFGAYGKIKLSDPDAPISVSFAPELFEGMSPNIISYPSKQGANGQNVTDEYYSIDVTVSLTDRFLEQTPVVNSGLEYSYQFTCFVVPSEYCNSNNITDITSHAVYTCHNDGKYFYNDASIDVDFSTGQNNQTGYYSGGHGWVCAEGTTNCFIIPRDDGTVSFNLPVPAIPFEQNKTYNFVILSHLSRRDVYGWASYPYYFKSSCPDLAFSSKKSVPVSVDWSTNETETVELYDYYTIVSDPFSYSTLPEYEEGHGSNKSPIDFVNTERRMQDYEMHMQTGGEQSWRTPDDFAQYEAQKQWSSNFTSDFGVGDISDLLSGESNFFHFLTASISVLPSWFLTILSSFFLTLLALVLVRFIL